MLISPVPPPDESSWTMWAIGGMGAGIIVCLTAITWWVKDIKEGIYAYIKSLKDDIDGECKVMRQQIDLQESKAQAQALDDAKRYATRDDLNQSENRITHNVNIQFVTVNEQLSNITKLLISRDNK